MTIKYLFIDDDVATSGEAGAGQGNGDAEAYSRVLVKESDGKLEISAFQPGKLSDVLRSISEAEADGLILDVSFVNAGQKSGEAIAYDGITLAQQVRTQQTRGQLKNFPIVRLSKRDVVREYVNGDTTSDDLFDERLEKDDIGVHRQKAVTQLLSLATDYPTLEKFSASDRGPDAQAALLGLEPEQFSQLDSRIQLGLQRPVPVHNLAQYLSVAFLKFPGLLIGEQLLAVRLGVDISASPGWPAVMNALGPAAYRGVFHGAQPRFWMFAVTNWWTDVVGQPSLRKAEAFEKIELLASKCGLRDLNPILDNADSPGRRYWHICLESGLPADPAESFPLIDEFGHEPWHDTDYICLESARRHARTHKRLRPSDRQRAIGLRSQT